MKKENCNNIEILDEIKKEIRSDLRDEFKKQNIKIDLCDNSVFSNIINVYAKREYLIYEYIKNEIKKCIK